MSLTRSNPSKAQKWRHSHSKDAFPRLLCPSPAKQSPEDDPPHSISVGEPQRRKQCPFPLFPGQPPNTAHGPVRSRSRREGKYRPAAGEEPRAWNKSSQEKGHREEQKGLHCCITVPLPRPLPGHPLLGVWSPAYPHPLPVKVFQSLQLSQKACLQAAGERGPAQH